jgi:hypothetical protein
MYSEYHGKVIDKPNIFITAGNQGRFWVHELRFCNLLAETNALIWFFILPCLVSELQSVLTGTQTPDGFSVL